jgi:hypothetical protein
VYKKHFTDAALEQAPTTPGMKYRHYSPRAPITLLDVATHPAAAAAAGGDAAALAQLRVAAAARLVQLVQQHAVQVADDRPESQLTSPTQQLQADSDQLLPSVTKHGQVQAASGPMSDVHEQPPIPGSSRDVQVMLGVLRTSCQGAADVGLAAAAAEALHCKECLAARYGLTQGCGVQVVEMVLGDLADAGCAARQLFAALRAMDAQGVRHIIAEGVLEAGQGLAVMNRLRKAASHIVQLDDVPR